MLQSPDEPPEWNVWSAPRSFTVQVETESVLWKHQNGNVSVGAQIFEFVHETASDLVVEGVQNEQGSWNAKENNSYHAKLKKDVLGLERGVGVAETWVSLTSVLPTDRHPEESEPDKASLWRHIPFAGLHLSELIDNKHVSPPVDLPCLHIGFLKVYKVYVNQWLFYNLHQNRNSSGYQSKSDQNLKSHVKLIGSFSDFREQQVCVYLHLISQKDVTASEKQKPKDELTPQVKRVMNQLKKPNLHMVAIQHLPRISFSECL